VTIILNEGFEIGRLIGDADWAVTTPRNFSGVQELNKCLYSERQL
jgi:hypothetical protein